VLQVRSGDVSLEGPILIELVDATVDLGEPFIQEEHYVPEGSKLLVF